MGSSHKALLFLALLGFSSCVARRPAPESVSEPTEVLGPVISDGKVEEQPVSPEIYGPEIPPDLGVNAATKTDAKTEISTTTETAIASSTNTETATSLTTSTSTSTTADAAKLCLVLGPGMAKAMAEAAVLETIRKAKLPVHCVVGTEMGAVVAALYSFSNGNTNSLLWQLFKLNKDNYLNFPMLSLREPRSSGVKLNEVFRGVFRDTQIENMPIRFATVAVDDEADSAVEFQRGRVADALSASVAMPGVFDLWKVEKISYRSAAVTDPVPVELARKLGGNFIVIVDVLMDGGGAPGKTRFHRAFSAVRSLVKLQKREANFVIQVNTGAIAFDDFNRKGEILATGSAAAEKLIPDLKAAWEKWVAETH